MYTFSLISNRARSFSLTKQCYIILSPHDRRQISQSSSSSFTTMFAHKQNTRDKTKQNLLSLTPSPVFSAPFRRSGQNGRQNICACVLSLGVFPLLYVLLKRAQSASFFSLLLCFVAGQKLGFDPLNVKSLDFEFGKTSFCCVRWCLFF